MSLLPDQLRQITNALIATRSRAGLSQRALGAKVGLAQSHISKIERAAVDPQVSSLMEISRALGLELMLIPTRLVPAIQALQREAVPDPRHAPSAIDHDLTRLARHARDRPAIELTAVGRNAAEVLVATAHAMRSLRNEWIHRDRGSSESPAYRLDDYNA
jgi:transcriptional regulator with XRE-family HTH domain